MENNQEQQKEQPKEATISPEAKELAELKALIAKEKADAKANQLKQAEELARKGELEKTLEIYKAQLSELEQIKPLAERWQKFEQSELKRLEQEADQLPEQFKQLFSKQPTLEDKREFLSAFNSVAPQDKGKPKSPVFSPPTSDRINYDDVLKDHTGQLARQAREKDPEGFRAFMSGLISGKRKQMTAADRFGGARK